jgi:hypothetical protein
MWTKTHTMTTRKASAEQMWKLFADVNNWHRWDNEIEYAKIDGEFQQGNHFLLKPKNGPKVKIQLVETARNRKFVDLTRFPLAKMYGEHTFEETEQGLKITTTMKVEGLLTALWVKLVASGIASNLPVEMEKQVDYASGL